MKYETFKEILKSNKLTIKKFSELANISYNTCNAWSKRGIVSNWVEPFLKLYIEHKKLNENGMLIDEKEYKELIQLKESLKSVMSGLNK